ncbi:MAG: hypothetical protein U9P38_08710 [Campylobacterota bacterium]|nr:hypothetical protein [Campylobacterota bacterium]
MNKLEITNNQLIENLKSIIITSRVQNVQFQETLSPKSLPVDIKLGSDALASLFNEAKAIASYAFFKISTTFQIWNSVSTKLKLKAEFLRERELITNRAEDE